MSYANKLNLAYDQLSNRVKETERDERQREISYKMGKFAAAFYVEIVKKWSLAIWIYQNLKYFFSSFLCAIKWFITVFKYLNKIQIR